MTISAEFFKNSRREGWGSGSESAARNFEQADFCSLYRARVSDVAAGVPPWARTAEGGVRTHGRLAGGARW